MRSAFALLLLASLAFAGCIRLEDEQGPPPASVARAATNPPVRLSAAFSLDAGSHSFQAWAENQGKSMMWTRGNCYSPWSWQVLRNGEPVQTGPVLGTCQPISWAQMGPGDNQTKLGAWNGTVFKPRQGDAHEAGDYEKAPHGDYTIEVRFSFYRSQDESRYCCPEFVKVTTGVRVG